MNGVTGDFLKLTSPLKTTEQKRFPITQLRITSDGKYFAVCDTNKAVSLFKKDHLNNDKEKPIEWQFNGKIISHEVDVTDIAFGEGIDDNGDIKHRLFSIGKDRRLFEYNIYTSTAHERL